MKKALGKRIRLESPPPEHQPTMAEVNPNYRPHRPLIIGRESRRPSFPDVPAIEPPSHGNLHHGHSRMTNLGAVVPGNSPNISPAPTRVRCEEEINSVPGRQEEINSQQRRRLLLPRWLMRPCVRPDQLPTPSVADGSSELVLVDVVCGNIVRVHESCEDASNPEGPIKCTTCILFCLTNANVRLPT